MVSQVAPKTLHPNPLNAGAVSSVGVSMMRAVDGVKWVDSVVKSVKVDEVESAVQRMGAVTTKTGQSMAQGFKAGTVGLGFRV